MITSTIYLSAAYGFVFIVLLMLTGFYIWRNIALSRQVKQVVHATVPAKGLTRYITHLRLLPFLCFVAIALLAVFFLITNGRQEDGASYDIMIGQNAPMVHLPLLDAKSETETFTISNLAGRVTIVNFWASWCAPCRLEHPLLMQLAQDDRFELIGINYKDEEKSAQHFLEQLGNPFTLVAVDRRGRAAIEWGVLGAPETYVIDGRGVITYRHIGPLTPDLVANRLLPALDEALP